MDVAPRAGAPRPARARAPAVSVVSERVLLL